MQWIEHLTWNDIARVHGIFVLDEAETVHEFNFCNLAGAMGLEMSFNIGLCGCTGLLVSDAKFHGGESDPGSTKVPHPKHCALGWSVHPG